MPWSTQSERGRQCARGSADYLKFKMHSPPHAQRLGGGEHSGNTSLSTLAPTPLRPPTDYSCDLYS